MPLSLEQIQEIVKQKPSKREVQIGRNHEQRLRFHTQTILQKSDLGGAFREWLMWLGNENPKLLASDKMNRIEQLVRTPISTIELTEQIFTKLSKVFTSQDAFFEYSFSDPKLLEDWDAYRDKSFWATHGFEAMKTAIDSVWVLDFPEFESESPEPMDRLIDIDDVIGIDVNRNNDCEWIVFKHHGYYYAYDEVNITVVDDKGKEVQTVPHNIGYTPARMMWSEKLEKDNNVNKEAPITKVLSDLDWLLFHKTAKKYLDIANAYPILAAYESDSDITDQNITENKGEKQHLEGERFMGPGAFLELPVPRTPDEADQMTNPVKYISLGVDVLDWHVAEEKRLMSSIYRSVVGIDQVSLNDVAKNEDQVESTYESQDAVLLRVKRNFEIIQAFADKTKCIARYGDKFKGCQIDYGTRFFLKTVNDLYGDYKHAKDSGADDVVLSNITESILNTQYRDDGRGRTRAEIIRDIDPLPEKTTQESIDIFNAGAIDKINFVIKINLLNFVRRFERENISLENFAVKDEYSTKIDKILTKFKEYANERGLQESVQN